MACPRSHSTKWLLKSRVVIQQSGLPLLALDFSPSFTPCPLQPRCRSLTPRVGLTARPASGLVLAFPAGGVQNLPPRLSAMFDLLGTQTKLPALWAPLLLCLWDCLFLGSIHLTVELPRNVPVAPLHVLSLVGPPSHSPHDHSHTCDTHVTFWSPALSRTLKCRMHTPSCALAATGGGQGQLCLS